MVKGKWSKETARGEIIDKKVMILYVSGMRVTAVEEYGLRLMLQMASAGKGNPLTIHEIASRESLSDAYVAKLMNQLRDAGLVDSTRGRLGGYRMTKEPEQISVFHILNGLGGHIYEDEYCERFPGESDACVHVGDCSLRSLWGTLEGLVNSVLQRTTLADLMQSEARAAQDIALRQRRQLPMAPEGTGAPGDRGTNR